MTEVGGVPPAAWASRSLVTRLRYRGRDLRYRRLFEVLGRHCSGDVVDVGGGPFVATAIEHGVPFGTWTVVEPHAELLPTLSDERVTGVVGDGARLGFEADSFDTAISIQVLEHMFEPIAALAELGRVVRPGGSLVVMVPQTANLHHVPHHYQNFTRFWLEEAGRRLDLEVVEYHALGGAWSSVASRLLLQYAAVFGADGYRLPGARRGWRFWALLPLGLVVSALGFGSSMVMSLGDLEEEPNNHLIVFRKRP